MLANLLFPQQLPILFDRQNGLPIAAGAQLWDKYYRYYRTAVQDALRRSRRKPFQLGGVAGYDQLVGILSHLEQRQLIYGPDLFLSSLESRLRRAIKVTTERASDIRQARAFLQKVEHLLAHSNRPTWQPQSLQSETTRSGEVVSEYNSSSSCKTEEKVSREPKYKVHW